MRVWVVVDEHRLAALLRQGLPIFARLNGADAAIARDEGGDGLGPAIRHWIFGAHQGDITVESTPGAGTTVIVSLPRMAMAGSASSGQWA